MKTKTQLLTYFVVFGILSVSSNAAVIITGSGANDNLGNAQAWSGSDYTKSSIMVDLRFDFTTTAAATSSYMWLWEFGAGIGSSLTISDTDIYLTADDGSVSRFATGAHGLSGGTTGVQALAVFDMVADKLSIYVNGSLIAENTNYTGTDWAGTDASVLAPTGGGGGDEPAGTIAYPSAGSANFSMTVYTLGDGTGGTTQLSEVLIPVPEPSALLMGMVGLLLLLRRRRYA